MATKAQKNDKIAVIKEAISKAKVAIVTDPLGLSVSEITDLRRQLQKEESDYTVVKNTLAIKAIEGTEFEALKGFLKESSAIAFGFNDQIAPAKVVAKYAKGNDKVKIKGAVLDGKAYSSEEVQELAKLPSKEELFSRILGSINSPATGIVGCVNGVMSALVRAMDQVRQQKSA